ESDLGPDESDPKGKLTPARVFSRGSDEDGNLGETGFKFSANIDPFLFLSRGGFIDERGFEQDSRHQSDAIYGGKSVYRVASQSSKNAVLHPNIPTLTEHRIEISHTS